MARPHNSPDVFRAIAHPVRRKILDMLRAGPLSAAEIGEPFQMSQPSISEHLRTLRIAGLITAKAKGQKHSYSIVLSQLRPIEQWVRQYF
jgi:DNA-binding transcriptional ArsR family regulator